EAERRQPPLHHEAIRLCDGRLQTFEYDRARFIAADAQPVDSVFESFQVERRRCRDDRTIQHPLDEIAQLSRAGFLPLFERGSELLVYIKAFTDLTRHRSLSSFAHHGARHPSVD